MTNKKGTYAGMLSGLFWGLGLTISGIIFSLYDILPFIISIVHDFLSIFLLAIIILIKYKKIDYKIFYNIKNYSVVIAAILAGPVGMQLNLFAVKYIGASLTSAVTAIYPALAVLLSVFILKHKVNKQIFIGVGLIVIGLFSQTFEVINYNVGIYIGILFAFLCALAWASESVLSSYAMQNNLKPLEALFIRQITSFLIYLLIIPMVKVNLDFSNYNINIYYLVIFLVFSNMASYIFYYVAIDNLQPSKATGLNVSYVLWTVIFSYLFLETQVSLKIILTSIIITIGVYKIIKE